MTVPVTAPETALMRDLRGLARDLTRIYQADFVSLILYGPSVDLPRAPRDGEVQVLIVLRDPGLPMLEKAQELMAAWWRSHRLAPLFLGEQEFFRSLDVFPLEFTHMRKRYICLHGQDVLAAMVIQPEHLRLQVEESLKTRAFWLRQFYVRDGRKERQLRELLSSTFNGLLEICDGLLVLRGQMLPQQPEAIIQAVARAYGLDITLLRALLGVARGQAAPKHQELIGLALACDRLLNSLINTVDRMEAP